MTYTVRIADIHKDKQELLSLWKNNIESSDEKRYEWIYQKNPTGPPQCFLLCKEVNEAIVGAITLFPRNISIQGILVPAFVCGDLMVARGHRTLGPAIKLIREAVLTREGNSPKLIYGFPNQLSEKLMIRAGFEKLGCIMEMTRILRSYPYIKKYVKTPFIGNVLSKLVDKFLQFNNLRFYNKKTEFFESDQNTLFNTRFDNFWHKMLDNSPFLGERNSRYLNWRFHQSPYKRYSVCTLSSLKGSNLIGYIVYSINCNRARIEDIAFLGSENIFKNLLMAFIRHINFKNITAVTISIAGNLDWINLFKKNGFFLRASEKKTIIFNLSKDKNLINKIKKYGWILTPADNDI